MHVIEAAAKATEQAGRHYQRELKHLDTYELLDLIDDMVDAGGKKIIQVIDTFVTQHASTEKSSMGKPGRKTKLTKMGSKKKKKNPIDNFKGKMAKPFKKGAAK